MDRGKAVLEADDDEEENPEEIEGFDDFTIASTWERFISEIEGVCRLWLVDGNKNLMNKSAEKLNSRRNLYRVKYELKYGIKLYVMEYYFDMHKNDVTNQWDDDLHSLQLSFGVTEFLVIAPLSANGVVLDAPESSKLLSAAAIALSNCGSNWPVFVPVHVPSRKAYIGIQNMGTIFTRRFDADRIGSQVPVRLMHLEGLYELFVSKFALTSVDFSTNYFPIWSTMRLTYRTPPFDDDDTEILEQLHREGKEDGVDLNDTKKQWDYSCPWAKWYSAEDPFKGFELTAIWPNKMFESSLEMAELENESPFDTEKWFLLPIISQKMVDDSIGKFGFASQLRLLVSALDKSFEARYLEDFVSAENLGSDVANSSSYVPPLTVIDRILKELFHSGSNYMEPGSKNSHSIKGAPLDSLFAQFCLHSLWIENCNIRAISTLWIEFVREVRWCWEESQLLPKMPASSGIDLSNCLLHQKLQMLAMCIEKKGLLDDDHQNGDESEASVPSGGKMGLLNQSHDMLAKETLGNRSSARSVAQHDSPGNSASSCASQAHKTQSSCLQLAHHQRSGSAGIVESMMLLRTFQNMHAPVIQDAPPMTEDMHEERLHVAEALGDVFSFPGQLEREILASDMSAFKAANPDAVFEDFIRWHSPGDWENYEADGMNTCDAVESPISTWPPKGRLSQRMSERGNSWRQIWNASPTLPASKQKPLFDPIREGEKILHYLETLQPQQLLVQMVCTAFRASADTLSNTTFGEFRLMKAKIDQLYHTLASTLRPLQENRVADKVEMIGDLNQLCTVFGHIENLVILASSVHHKLYDAPRLSEAIFQDYFNFYLPNMGTGSGSLCSDKEFCMKQLVKVHERDVIASFFPPPTANQSWRKVLSMGNLLFGHEPILREIIFSVYDKVSNFGALMDDVETHRMYICETSNDLRVALSVTSWD